MKTIGLSIFIAALLLGGFSANAAEAEGQLEASASVQSSCSITNIQSLNFGAYDPMTINKSTHMFGSTTIGVKCTAGSTGVILDLDGGKHPDPVYPFNCGNARRHMANTNGDILRYYLYTDINDRNVFWGCSFSPATGYQGNGTSQTLPTFTNSLNAAAITIHSMVQSGQDVPIGAYTDVINVGLIF